MDPIKRNPFRTLSEQAARRRAMYQLEKVGLLVSYKDSAGSWEYRTAYNGKFHKSTSRLSLVPVLTLVGKSIAALIADELKHNNKISWKNVIKQLPPDGVGLDIWEVKALWIQWINESINRRLEMASLVGRIGNYKAYDEETNRVELLRKQIAALEALDLTAAPDGLN